MGVVKYSGDGITGMAAQGGKGAVAPPTFLVGKPRPPKQQAAKLVYAQAAGVY